jgi:GH15 family glucan-1,4-alpha-glucosidase
MRGEPRHFVHSKVMCWTILDRGLKLAEHCLRQAPVKRWKKTRDEIRAAVEKKGYDEERGHFVQYFGARVLDSALLLLGPALRARLRRRLGETGLVRSVSPALVD